MGLCAVLKYELIGSRLLLLKNFLGSASLVLLHDDQLVRHVIFVNVGDVGDRLSADVLSSNHFNVVDPDVGTETPQLYAAKVKRVLLRSSMGSLPQYFSTMEVT